MLVGGYILGFQDFKNDWFSVKFSCNEAAQIYQYLLQHEPQMLQKFYRFVEETLKHIKEQHKAKDEMEVAFAQYVTFALLEGGIHEQPVTE